MIFVSPYHQGFLPDKQNLLPKKVEAERHNVNAFVSLSWLIGKTVVLGAHIEPYGSGPYPHYLGNWHRNMDSLVGTHVTIDSWDPSGLIPTSFDSHGLCISLKHEADYFWWRVIDFLSPMSPPEFVMTQPPIRAGALWTNSPYELPSKRILLQSMLSENRYIKKLPLDVPSRRVEDNEYSGKTYRVEQILDPTTGPPLCYSFSSSSNSLVLPVRPQPFIAQLSDGSSWPCHRLVWAEAPLHCFNIPLVGRI